MENQMHKLDYRRHGFKIMVKLFPSFETNLQRCPAYFMHAHSWTTSNLKADKLLKTPS